MAILTIALPTTTPGAVVRTTLTMLCASKGLTLAAVALAIGVDPVLLVRVEAARQPLSYALASAIAQLLGVDLGEVLGAAWLVTASSANAAVHRPLPPDPDRGEDYTFHAVAPTAVQGVVATGPRPSVWIAGDDFAGNPIVRRLHRHSGVVDAEIALVSTLTPYELVERAGEIWTFGTAASGGDFYAARIDVGSAVLETEATAASYVEPTYCVLEPASSTLWVTNAGDPTLLKVDPALATATASVTITDGVHNFTPQDLVAVGEQLYVVGQRAAPEGRVFQVDPTTAAVVAVSTGADLGLARGIAFDGDDTLFVTNAAGLLFAVSLTTLVATQVTLSAAMTDPEQVSFAFGYVWISDTTGGAAPRLNKVTPAGDVELRSVFTGPGRFGPTASDGVFLWGLNPAESMVRKFNPTDLSAVLTLDFNGEPRGLLVL